MKHSQSSSYLDLGHYKLHLRNLVPLKPSQAPVLMLHGAELSIATLAKALAAFLLIKGFQPTALILPAEVYLNLE